MNQKYFDSRPSDRKQIAVNFGVDVPAYSGEHLAGLIRPNVEMRRCAPSFEPGVDVDDALAWSRDNS